MAAVRSSALDRLFQRHHRPAEADRARPWRHRASWRWRCSACTTTSAARYAPTTSASATTGTASTGWIMWNSQVGGAARRHHLLHLRRQPRRHARTSRTGPRLWRFVGEIEGDLLRRRRGVLRQLRQGRDRSRRRRRPVAAALPRLDRLAAQRRHASLVQRPLRRLSKPTAARRRPTSGGPTSPAAPISPAPSSAAIASCRRRRARCSAACSGARSKPGASRAAP